MDYATATYHLKKALGNNYSNAPIVYVVSFKKNEAPFKIGLTFNLKQRLGNYRTAFLQFYVYYVFITAIESLGDVERSLHTNKLLEKDRLKFPKSIYSQRTNYSEWFMTNPSTIEKAFHEIRIPIIMAYKFNNRNMKDMPLKYRLELDGTPEFTTRGRKLKRQTKTILVKGKKYQVAVGDSVDSNEDDTKGIIYKMRKDKSCVIFNDGFSRCYDNKKIAEHVFH